MRVFLLVYQANLWVWCKKKDLEELCEPRISSKNSICCIPWRRLESGPLSFPDLPPTLFSIHSKSDAVKSETISKNYSGGLMEMVHEETFCR